MKKQKKIKLELTPTQIEDFIRNLKHELNWKNPKRGGDTWRNRLIDIFPVNKGIIRDYEVSLIHESKTGIRIDCRHIDDVEKRLMFSLCTASEEIHKRELNTVWFSFIVEDSTFDAVFSLFPQLEPIFEGILELKRIQ